LAFQGTAFVLVANKLVIAHPAVFWAGVLMICVGAFILLARDLQSAMAGRPGALAPAPRAPADTGPTIGRRLIERVTLGGRLNRLFPLFGLGVIAFDLLFNQYLTPTPQLLSTDFVVLGLGAALIAFPFFPPRMSRERDFSLLFFAALALIFGVPLIALRLGHDPYASVDEYTAALVAPQLAWLVNLLGSPVTFAGNDLWYFDQTNGALTRVHIATSCSGLYSMGIFIAAFAALVLSEYTRLTPRVGTLLVAGILLAYFANLLRMVVIVEVGYYYGSPALLWTHANLGDLIFLLWVVPFMWMTYRVLDPASARLAPLDDAAFAAALRAQGIDPDTVTEADWFCASCFKKVDAATGAEPTECPACGAALA
jgi:archaeosortase C (PEF-CTERM variant)